ncbi:MAG: glycosyl hydrolase [Acidobacteriota bacterium]
MPVHVPRRVLFLALIALLLTAPAVLAERPAPNAPATPDALWSAWADTQKLDAESPFAGLSWRSIGPTVQGGRIIDIEGIPGNPYGFYAAAASGGLWRTVDNGGTWEPLFDFQPTTIIGDMAVDPRNPDRLWVGTGENNSSRSSYGGLGVFVSDDAGASWRHAGLDTTDRIGRVVVDPRDSNRVFVAAHGKLYTQGGDRGVFRTDDGGATWKHVLVTEGWTGAIELVLHPTNPDIVYTATWERSRRPWNFTEGGPGSAIWKSTDGGDTWSKLDGFPSGEHVGRIGLAVTPASPDTLYASLDNQMVLPEDQWDMGDSAVNAKRLKSMTKEEFLEQDPAEIDAFVRGNDLDTDLDGDKLIEMVKNDEVTIQDLLDELSDANNSLFQTDIHGIEVYRSDDAGATWAKTHDEPIRDVVFTYGYYFGQIGVSPANPDEVYVLGVPIIKSTDGGKSFFTIQQEGVHVDYQAIWFDPANPQRVIVGNDGGIDESFDGGLTWRRVDEMAIGQFYTIMVDDADPYNVYGGTQDNGTLKGPNTSRPGIGPGWQFIGGGDGMYVQIDPRDGTTYVGFQFGFYFRRGPDRQTVRPRDKLGEQALRYNWATPVHLSPHSPEIVYFGANKLYRSMDRGETWTAISPDLTTSPERGDVPFGTITTVAESPITFGVIWAGTDDGHVHVTSDNGTTWSDVGAGLPKDRWVSRVEASRDDIDVAYVSLSGYRDDDLGVYLYRTADRGKTWTSIAGNLPEGWINVVREDTVDPNILYVGTRNGVYVSHDLGGAWHALTAGLPKVPVHDLVIQHRERELVAGTHGRSAWVIDILPVQEWAERKDEALSVYPLESVDYDNMIQGRLSQWFDASDYLPELEVPFWTSEAGTIELAVLDQDDRELRTLSMYAEAGVNAFTWDLLLDQDKALAAEKEAYEATADKGDGEEGEEGDEGTELYSGEGWRANVPWAEAVRLGRRLEITPGSYTIELRRGEETARTDLKVTPGEPPPPRKKPEPKIRGEKDKHVSP